MASGAEVERSWGQIEQDGLTAWLPQPPTLTDRERLALISHTGINVDLEDGHIFDSAGRPGRGRDAQGHLSHFSEEDDRVLGDWVRKAEVQGLSTSGSKIFEDLERIHPRHTSVGWQARWTTHLKDKCTAEASVSDALVPLDARLSTPPPHAHLGGPPTSPHGPASTRTHPTSRWLDDSSDPAPPHFRRLTRAEPGGRYTVAHLRQDSAKTLRLALGLQSQDELCSWLKQDWVIDAYTEYAVAELDPRRARERGRIAASEAIEPAERRSSEKYVVNNAINALQSNSARYLTTSTVKRGWTKDDHDIRFVTQIVDSGRMVGRWWGDGGQDVGDLCAVAFRLMSWLRFTHRLTAATNSTSQWQMASGHRWVTMLSNARAERFQQLQSRPTQAAEPGTATLKPTTFASAGPLPQPDEPCPGRSVASTAEMPSVQGLDPHVPLSSTQLPRLFETSPNSSVSDLSPDPVSMSPTSVTLEPLRESHHSSGHTCGDQDESDSDEGAYYTPRSSFLVPRETRDDHNDSQENDVKVRDVNRPGRAESSMPSLPGMPLYSVKQSKKVVGQIKGWDWMTPSGVSRFKAQQDVLLAAWGVTTEYESSCVLVPMIWSALNPVDLVDSFGHLDCPPENLPRLTFRMLDHSTPWVRAATWFAAWPEPGRTGVEFDNFLGCGPFQPMEGSHRCHHGECILPRHAEYEDGGTNSTRNRCCYTARDLRRLEIPVPEFCNSHEPPCLLQLAALTTLETYLIQFSVLRQAKGLPAVTPSKPADHPFKSFEHKLPLSFATHPRPMVDPSQLVDNGVAPLDSALQSPTFYCRFCSVVKAFKSITGYWSHIRDKHGLVQTRERLDEIKRAGTVWRDHLAYFRNQGHGVCADDATQVKLAQIHEDNFDWEVVRSWKLRYQRER